MVGFLARAALVVVVYAAIGRTVNFSDLTVELTSSLAYAVAGAIVLTLIQAAICTYRWILVAGTNVPGFRASYLAYMEGLFVNQVLPSVVGGDALRIIRWREYGVSTADAVVSVLGDRVFGVLGAAALALASVAQLSSLGVDQYWMPIAWALSAAGDPGLPGFLLARLFGLDSEGREPF